jgi:hypothetical protein
MYQQPPVGHGFLIMSLHSHTQLYTPHSIELLWTSDKLDADNTQHPQDGKIHAPCGIQIRNPSKRAAADRLLRPRLMEKYTLETIFEQRA